MVNSRYRLFVATPTSSRREALHRQWHTLSRSYGVNLPSSLTRILSNALVYSTRPPESVSGTVSSPSTKNAAFLGSLDSTTSTRRQGRHLGVMSGVLFLPLHLRARAGIHTPDLSILLRPCSSQDCWCGNINPLPIGYAVRLHLRGRLTLPGLSLDRKPWAFGDKGFHLVCRYSCQHSHFLPLHTPSPGCFIAAGTLPYHSAESKASVTRLAPLYLRRRTT